MITKEHTDDNKRALDTSKFEIAENMYNFMYPIDRPKVVMKRDIELRGWKYFLSEVFIPTK